MLNIVSNYKNRFRDFEERNLLTFSYLSIKVLMSIYI